mgnify:CR=1 FL=1
MYLEIGVKMSEKTFKEKFPGLKGKGLLSLDTNCLQREDIQKHCLDKQRTFKIIEELSDDMNNVDKLELISRLK